MFQPIQIETQSEQQGLAHLRVQGSTWCASREFSFDRGEQALDQGAAGYTPRLPGRVVSGRRTARLPWFLLQT